MTDHPALERILDRVLGRSAPNDGIAEHLTVCTQCREAEAWATALVRAAGGPPPAAAPEEMITRAVAIPIDEPRRHGEPERRWSIARLVGDAFARPILAGVRGAATARRMLYELPDGHVDLEIVADPEAGERLRITAQVLFDDAGGPIDVVAILLRDTRLVARASAEETGIFVMKRIEPGDYRLEILSPGTGRAIRIDGLRVEGEQA